MWRTALQFYNRERRSTYWAAILMHCGISLVAFLIFGSIGMSWIFYLYSILSIEPIIAITVRRLHDVNISGKRCFLLLVPVVGWLMLFAYLIADSTPADNDYGESLKYLHLKDPISPLTHKDIAKNIPKTDITNDETSNTPTLEKNE